MKKLIDQILKFGVVGIISFIVDFVITMAVSTGLRQGAGMGTSQAALIGAFSVLSYRSLSITSFL